MGALHIEGPHEGGCIFLCKRCRLQLEHAGYDPCILFRLLVGERDGSLADLIGRRLSSTELSELVFHGIKRTAIVSGVRCDIGLLERLDQLLIGRDSGLGATAVALIGCRGLLD